MTSCPEAMSAVVAALAPVLKDAGLQKRRYSFNRSADDGLVHVFDFRWVRQTLPARPISLA
jgi:hypothetical protein